MQQCDELGKLALALIPQGTMPDQASIIRTPRKVSFNQAQTQGQLYYQLVKQDHVITEPATYTP